MAHDEYDHLRESADAAEAESIEKAEDIIRMAQRHAVHDRLEDLIIYMDTVLQSPGEIMKFFVTVHEQLKYPEERGTEYLFEFIEEYLDNVDEHEDRSALDQILHPDMTEFIDES